ncbi:MAG TPA: hypothetical protein VMB84_12945, partial [Stellaceae bacterium]|nr:hypothetical protein [Stellaceae bacterium]
MAEARSEPMGARRAAVRAALPPLLRHGFWLAAFLALAPVIDPHDYGVFVVALGGVAIAEALVAEPASHALAAVARIDERLLATALATLMVVGAIASATFYMAADAIGKLGGGAAGAERVRSLSVLPLLGALGAVPTA